MSCIYSHRADDKNPLTIGRPVILLERSGMIQRACAPGRYDSSSPAVWGVGFRFQWDLPSCHHSPYEVYYFLQHFSLPFDLSPPYLERFDSSLSSIHIAQEAT